MIAESSQPGAEDEGGSLWPWLLGLVAVIAVVGGLAALRRSARRRRAAWRRRTFDAAAGAAALADDITVALDASDLAAERWATFAQRAEGLAGELAAAEPGSPDDILRAEVGRLRSAIGGLGSRLVAPPAPGEGADLRGATAEVAGIASSLRDRVSSPAPASPPAP